MAPMHVTSLWLTSEKTSILSSFSNFRQTATRENTITPLESYRSYPENDIYLAKLEEDDKVGRAIQVVDGSSTPLNTPDHISILTTGTTPIFRVLVASTPCSAVLRNESALNERSIPCLNQQTGVSRRSRCLKSCKPAMTHAVKSVQ